MLYSASVIPISSGTCFMVYSYYFSSLCHSVLSYSPRSIYFLFLFLSMFCSYIFIIFYFILCILSSIFSSIVIKSSFHSVILFFLLLYTFVFLVIWNHVFMIIYTRHASPSFALI